MHSFRYQRPRDLAAALAVLSQDGPTVRPLAGGTDLIVQLQKGARLPAIVLDLKHIAEFAPAVSISDSSVAISALTTMADLCNHGPLAVLFPALAEAAACVGSPQIRNRATIGGNLCNASPAADTAVPLLSLDASVTLVGPAGTRTLPLQDFFTGPGASVLAAAELLASISIPRSRGLSSSAFERLTRRRGVDLACVSVACCVYASGRAVFGLGAVAPTPIRIECSASTLAVHPSNPRELDALFDAVANQAHPITDIRAGRVYRDAMLRELLRRAHARALARLSALP
jgi:CO/xanthine dehydrogenase FAD-binding subunit